VWKCVLTKSGRIGKMFLHHILQAADVTPGLGELLHHRTSVLIVMWQHENGRSEHLLGREYSKVRHIVYLCEMLHCSLLTMKAHALITAQLAVEDLPTTFKARELNWIEVIRCMTSWEMYCLKRLTYSSRSNKLDSLLCQK